MTPTSGPLMCDPRYILDPGARIITGRLETMQIFDSSPALALRRDQRL